MVNIQIVVLGLRWLFFCAELRSFLRALKFFKNFKEFEYFMNFLVDRTLSKQRRPGLEKSIQSFELICLEVRWVLVF